MNICSKNQHKNLYYYLEVFMSLFLSQFYVEIKLAMNILPVLRKNCNLIITYIYLFTHFRCPEICDLALKKARYA